MPLPVIRAVAGPLLFPQAVDPFFSGACNGFQPRFGDHLEQPKAETKVPAPASRTVTVDVALPFH